MYGNQDASEMIPDLLIQDENDTYRCFYDPSKANKSIDAPEYEDQEIWQIVLIRQWTQENGLVVTKTLYPNGSSAHDFAPNNIQNYHFRYRL